MRMPGGMDWLASTPGRRLLCKAMSMTRGGMMDMARALPYEVLLPPPMPGAAPPPMPPMRPPSMPPPPGRLSISGMPAMVPVDRSIHSCTLGALVFWAWAPRLAMHRPAARQAGVM